MAKDQSRRLKPSILLADESAYVALTAISTYSPANPALSIDVMTTTQNDVAKFRNVESEALAAATAARQAAIAKEWEFHNLMLGVKAQVIAQFGVDSDELASLGIKKKSDYKPPGRKSAKK